MLLRSISGTVAFPPPAGPEPPVSEAERSGPGGRPAKGARGFPPPQPPGFVPELGKLPSGCWEGVSGRVKEVTREERCPADPSLRGVWVCAGAGGIWGAGQPPPALPPRPGGVNGGPGAHPCCSAPALCLKLPLKLGPRHLPVPATGWPRSAVERGRGKSCAKKKNVFVSCCSSSCQKQMGVCRQVAAPANTTKYTLVCAV